MSKDRASTRATSSRRHARPRRRDEPEPLDEQTGLPAFLVQEVREQYGDVAERVIAGWQAHRPVTLRANALRSNRDEVARTLDGARIGWQVVPWYADAFVLEAGVRERQVWDLPVYQQGKVYLQGLSSMLPPLALGPRAGADVLDMCAAPGGKTSQLAALCPGVHLTACELSHPRAERLEHNLAKLGATSAQVLRCDARRLDEWFSFDQILLDAPCTGSGTVRAHDAHAARHLTRALASRCGRSQRTLLERAITVLKPGGTLVYSTCSILRGENEDVVTESLARHPDVELVEPGLDLGTGPLAPATLPCRLGHALLVCPNELFDGFFVARLRKLG